MSDVEKLLQALRIVSEQMTGETIKEATNEQLLEYTVLINRIKAILKSSI